MAHGFVQLLQAFMQRGKERIEGFTQLVLSLILLVNRFSPACFSCIAHIGPEMAGRV